MDTTKKEYEVHKRSLRSLKMGEEMEDTLLENGYVSPFHIARTPKRRFIREAGRNLRMSAKKAEEVYQRADKISQKAIHMYMNIRTTLGSDYYRALKTNGITEEFKNEFEEIVNYQQLFGTLQYREGEEWESIFGPAAYFVDLMRIVDSYITSVYKGIPKGYTLPERRPDLENLKLSRENAETEVSYLSIVNERLRDAVKKFLATDHPEKAMAELIHPLCFPVNLPMEEIRTLLKQKGAPLSDIYDAMTQDKEAVYLETLSLSKDSLSLVIKPMQEEELPLLYGMKQQDLEKLKKKDSFMKSLGLSPQQCEELLNQGLKAKEESLRSRFYINRGLPEGAYVKEENGALTNLDYETLSRINRFARLSSLLQLSFEQTDFLISLFSDSGNLDEDFIKKAADSLALYRRTGLSFYEFFSLYGPLKTYGEDNPFDQVYRREVFAYHPKYKGNPLFTDEPVSWNKENDAAIAGWLSASLKRPAEDIKKVFLSLYPEDTLLTVETLSSLYAHCTLMNYFQFTAPEYLKFRSLFQGEPRFYLEGFDRMKKAGLSVYEMDFICNGNRNAYVPVPFTDESLREFQSYVQTLRGNLPLEEREREEAVLREVVSFLSAKEEDIRLLEKTARKAFGWKRLSELLDASEDKMREVFLFFSRCLLCADRGAPLPVLAASLEKGENFGISDMLHMEPDGLLAVREFADFLERYKDEEKVLLKALAFTKEDMATLAGVTGWDENTLAQIREKYCGGCLTAAEKLSVMEAVMKLQQKLSASLSFLELFLPLKDKPVSDFDGAEQIRKQTAAVLSAGLDKAEADQKGRKKRDCYLRIVCKEAGLKEEEVYKYLLIDPQMSEKTQITVLREAINAVQLYLKRCQMGLEKGVSDLEIDGDWQSYLMDYSLWRANREVFIYPENYLVPSLRHTKTSLFQKVESGLMQSNVDKNYLEDLYEQYFEGFANVAEIDICASLKADKALYLFGRTKKQPYSYYYCVRKNARAFSEWRPIEATIHGEYITPVYVKGRLYLFYAELRHTNRVSLNGAASVNHTVYQVSIRYIYQNTKEQWSTPQDLIQDEIVYYKEDGKDYTSNTGLFDGLFDMEDPIWKKVAVIPVNGKNYAPFMEKDESWERLCIFYGPLLNDVGRKVNRAPFEAPVSDEDGERFANKLKKIEGRYKNMLDQGEQGYMCAGLTRVYTLNFQESFLIRENEFLFFDEYAPAGKASVHSAQTSLLNRSMGAVASAFPIRDMFWGNAIRLKDGEVTTIDQNSFVNKELGIDLPMSTAVYKKLEDVGVIESDSRFDMPKVNETSLNQYDLQRELMDKAGILKDILQIHYVWFVLYDSIENQILFGGGLEPGNRLIPVANQPGAFIVDTGEETFLLEAVRKADKRPAYQNLDKGLTVSYPLVTTAILRENSKLAGKAEEIMDKLETSPLLDERHILRSKEMSMEALEQVLPLEEEEYINLYSCLLNDPLIDPAVFIDEKAGIDETLSGKLYEAFLANGYISDQRISLFKVYESYELEAMIEELLDEDKRTARSVNSLLDAVFRKLKTAAVPVSLKYWTSEACGSESLFYKATRLSNGASPDLKSRLGENGIETLLALDAQNSPIAPVKPFRRFETPEKAPLQIPAAGDGNGVDFEGLYGEYFWELFYHIPMLISQNRKDNGVHDECKKWQEYVFSPTNGPDTIKEDTFYQKDAGYFNMQESQRIYKLLLSAKVIDPLGAVDPEFDRELSCLKDMQDSAKDRVRNLLENAVCIPENSYYWKFAPFRKHKPEELKEMLSDNNEAILIYQEDPFDPHAVARLRIAAYEKYTVMQYVENIIAWGDREFMKNTWESLTLASMYYITASELLGPKPVYLGKEQEREPKTFADLKKQYDVIPQFLLESAAKTDNSNEDIRLSGGVPFTDLSLLFPIPENNMLTRLWDIAEDRLYKLRNCLDINGNERFTRTYAQRVDPMALVKAAQNAQSSLKPMEYSLDSRYPYRFSFLIEQAKTLASRLIAVGGQLLNVLERNDAEEIALVSASNEKLLSDMITSLKEIQIKETEKELEGLKNSYENSKGRFEYYQGLLEKDLSDGEKASLTASDTAFALSTASQIMKMAASAAHAIPQVGSPFAMTYGGVQIGSMMGGIAEALELGGGIANFISGRSSIMAGYERRREEWEQQKKSAGFEADSLLCQLEGYQEKLEQTKKDLEIHKVSIAQKEQQLLYLRNKYTNTSLYQWMLGRLNTVMWQTYQQALELARQAQEAFRYETGREEEFITYEYWDSAKKGLLSGENLLTSLNQMQMSYFKKNTRKLEIEKYISFSQYLPKALFDLKESGKCRFELTEEMFDYDYPGCYQRRIKNLSLSIPALLGPYQNIRAMLKQVETHKTLLSPDGKGARYLLDRSTENPPESVRVMNAGNECIAISRGLDDSGMFALNFGDERYLPFEGTGAVSSFELTMPKNTNYFDFDSITDVILCIRYEASFSEKLKDEVEELLRKDYPAAGSLYYSLAHAGYDNWREFEKETEEKGAHTLAFSFSPTSEYLKNKKIAAVYFKLHPKEGANEQDGEISLKAELPVIGGKEAAVKGMMGELNLKDSGKTEMDKLRGEWKLTYQGPALENMEMLVVYEGYLA